MSNQLPERTFTACDGLRFHRGKNGSVIVDLDGRKIELDRSTWASLIANMSYYGEEDYGWHRALNFHAGEPLGESTPLVDKPRPNWTE